MATTCVISSCTYTYLSIAAGCPGAGYGSYDEASSPAFFSAAKPTTYKIGQMVYDNGAQLIYYINRSYLSFDTSVIPGAILGASLWLTGAADYALSGPYCTGTCGEDFDVEVYRFDFTLDANGDLAPDDATGSANWYGAFGDAASHVGTLSSTSADYWEYAASSLSNFGMEIPASMIDTAGCTRFTLVSSRDISATDPGISASDLNAYDWWWGAVWAAGMHPTSYGGSDGWPRLAVTYAASGGYAWIF